MKKVFFAVVFCLFAWLCNGATIRTIRPPHGVTGSGVTYTNFDVLPFQGLTHFMNTSNFTSYVTASYTPTNDPNCFLIAHIHMTHATAPVAPTTVTGNGLTWTKIVDTNFSSLTVPTHNQSVWWAQGAGSAGTLKADFGATTATGCGIQVVQFENALLGAGAIVQTVVVGSNATANPKITITATSRAGTNGMIKFIADSVSSAADSTADTPNRWAEYAEDNYSTPAAGSTCDYSLSVFPSLTVTSNTMTSRDWAGVVVEIQPKQFLISSSTVWSNYADILIDGTNTIGSAMTGPILTNSARGAWNGWTPKFTTLTNIQSAASSHPLHSTVRLGSSTFYPAGSTSYALSYSNIVPSVTADLAMSSPPNNPIATTAGWLTPGMTNGTAATGQLFDFVAIYGNASGEYVALQLINGIGSSNAYALNIETNPGGVTTHSQYITLVTNQPYWMNMQGDFLAGQARLNVYSNDVSLMAAFTSTMSKQSTSGDTDFSPWRFGNNEVGVSSGLTYFENWLIDFRSQRFPIRP